MKSWIPALVGIGIILVFIGMVYGEYADDEDAMDAAHTVTHLGIFLGGLGFVVGAMVDDEIDTYLRLAMIIGGALFMALLWM